MKAIVFFKYAVEKFPFHVAIATFVMVVASLLEMTSLFSLAPVVDLFLHQDMQQASSLTKKVAVILKAVDIPVTAWGVLTVFLVINVLRTAFQLLSVVCISWTNNSIFKAMVIETYAAIFDSRWYLFQSAGQGKLLNTFISEVSVAGRGFLFVGKALSEAIMLIFCLLVPFYISWQVTLVGIGAGAALGLPFLFLGKRNYRLGQARTVAANQITGVLHESFAAAKIILGFGNQRESVEKLSPAIDSFCMAFHKSTVLREAVPLMYILSSILAVGCALYATIRLAVPLSETTVVLYSLMRGLPYVGRLAGAKNTLDNSYPSFLQIQKLKDRAAELRQKSGSKPFAGLRNQIAVEEVYFAYQERGIVLENINIRIPQGTMIGLVGESGAGKSSLIDVIMGFNEPSRGTVTIDGVPLFDYDINSYRKRIGYVPQDPILFNASIRENLLWAKPDATNDDIDEACRRANAMEFITDLPEGQNTVVGDRGVRLSGGQCQRVALARAILRRPDLLILDEATSSLDTHSERLIQESIDALAKEATLIVIAHRLSTIVNADYIYVLEKGRVVEEGTYEHLTQLDGRFNKMVELQALKAVS